MPTIHITRRDGSQISLDSPGDITLMELMTRHDLEVDGVCGGSVSCGTCHVLVDPLWIDRIGPANAAEVDLLEGLMHVTTTSRLGCQIELTLSHDGLDVTIAPEE